MCAHAGCIPSRTARAAAWKVFGTRFAVYGRGWEGFLRDRGPLPFDRQHEVLRRSWLSVGYDDFPGTPYYFSDRLPIALLSGVAHVAHFHPGYDTIFGNGRELLWAHSLEEIVETVRYALGRGPSILNELGAQGREFALSAYLRDRLRRADRCGLCRSEDTMMVRPTNRDLASGDIYLAAALLVISEILR